MLYAFGSNGSGQLGLGHCDDVSTPSKVSLPASAVSQTPIKITAGGNHTLLLVSTGEVYACGQNVDGRCATTSKGDLHKKFQRCEIQLPGNSTVTKFRFCAATWESSTFVDEEGRVFTTGTGSRGQLGRGQHITSSTVPKVIPDFPPPGTYITDLAASMGHTVAVLSDGSAYGWGTGRKGQLGMPSVDCWIPRRIDGIPFHAMQAACGKDFTFIAGDSKKAQHLVLGSDKWHVRSAAPRDISGWKGIAASWGSIYVVLDSGRLLAWGRGDHRQIPSGDHVLADKVAAGSEHVVVLHEATGICRAYGWGEHGNCGELEGSDDTSNNGNFVSVDTKILGIGAGCATSWIFT
ncbi:MAG: hypothetical protein M1822_009658 [Bathelium mastoideum]|nr:MAG: hypothetical protein M1822_009658 [Bathelium mastoideum]